ncbi:hypothetical protein [Glaciecola siphonariae]
MEVHNFTLEELIHYDKPVPAQLCSEQLKELEQEVYHLNTVNDELSQDNHKLNKKLASCKDELETLKNCIIEMQTKMSLG